MSDESPAISAAQVGTKHLTFRLAKEEYAVPILSVREIIGIMPMTSLPGTPSYIEGVINLRGKIIPVMDLRSRLDMPWREPTRETCIIVLRFEGLDLGVVVDSVCDVRLLQPSESDTIAELGSNVPKDFFRGISKTDGKVRLLLDIDRLFALESVAGQGV
jgi:purine-binding chemotaxis protein CheW